MKTAITLLSTTGALLLALGAPASAFVTVVGNELAHQCFEMAKAGDKSQAALDTCDDALDNAPLTQHDRAGTLVNRGSIKLSLNRVEDAMEDDNRSIAIMPELGDSYVDRAAAFIFQKKYDQAIADANRGIELGSYNLFVGYYNRAVAEQLMGKFTEAYYDYQKTLELEPKFTPAAERLKDFVVTRKPPATPSG